MNGVPSVTVSSSHTSIHPDTQGDSITPWWARMENQSRGYGDKGESNVWALGTTQTGNLPWCRGSLPCSSSWTQHVLLHPLQAPMRSIAMPCQLSDPTPAALIRTLPLPPFFSQASLLALTACIHSHHHMDNRSRDGFRCREIDERCVWIGVECNSWFSWSSADL